MRQGHTKGYPWVISVHDVPNDSNPMPSLEEPAPNKLRMMLGPRPLLARQMTENAVRSGKGY